MITPCLAMLHEIWGTWCMISPYMVQDGYSHERRSTMDLQIGDGLLNSCLTSVGCSLGILPWVVRDLLTTCDLLHDGHMEMDCLLGECLASEKEHFASWKRTLSPR